MCFFDNGRFVGEDEFGNKYYIKKEKRYVIYNGKMEATKISPCWHLWLHYASDMTSVLLKNSWQKLREPNFTGTSMAYKPPFFKKIKNIISYERWLP